MADNTTDPTAEADVSTRVRTIVAEQAKVELDAVTPTTTLKDLGVASIEAIEVIFDIEEHFDITFPDEGANFDTDTVQHLIDAVQQALAQKAAAAEGSP